MEHIAYTNVEQKHLLEVYVSIYPQAIRKLHRIKKHLIFVSSAVDKFRSAVFAGVKTHLFY